MVIPKELVEKALRREDVDRIPFCPPFQGYWALENAGIMIIDSIKNPKLAAKAQLNVVKSCKIDAVETMWDWLLPAEFMGCEVKIPEYGTIPTLSHIIREVGDLDKYFVPTGEDIVDFYRLAGARETTRVMARHIGNDHYLMASLLSPFTLAGELRGVEAMMMDCMIEEDFVRAIVQKALEIDTVFAEEICKWDMDAVILCDPTASGDLISGDDYAKLSMKSTKSLGNIVRKNGKDQINHICGDTSDRLDHVADTGCIAFSLDFQVDIGAAVKKMRDRIAIIGNINPAATLFSGTVDDVKRSTLEHLQQGGRRGFLLGSGCDIPVGTKIENVKAISEVIDGFRS